jgi:selenocysteine lyase/cysteine desulfurase
MFSLFSPNKKTEVNQDVVDFSYLDRDIFYFDSACQTLRPQSVIDAEVEYYYKYNSCGHRVKYKWGQETDKKVEECRENLIKLSGKNSKDFTVAFGLNTTAGINTILMQLPVKNYKSILTSEIEHNSVFLPSLVYSQKNNIPRKVLERDIDGSLKYSLDDLSEAIVILNTTSNIDGRELKNVEKLAKDIHSQGGVLLLDACQTLSHHPELLQDVDFDAIFGSGHKMYGPSVGFTIIKKSLLKKLEPFLIGGSTVSNVEFDSYELIDDDTELYSRIEPGLQNYAGIIGLNAAIKWRKSFKIEISKLEAKFTQAGLKTTDFGFKSNQTLNASEYEHLLSIYLNHKLKKVSNIVILNQESSPVVSLYSTKKDLDGHKLAMYLSEAGVSCRSGYHCCHYYLIHKLKLPPLFRISLALHNDLEQIDYLVDKLSILTKD